MKKIFAITILMLASIVNAQNVEEIQSTGALKNVSGLFVSNNKLYFGGQQYPNQTVLCTSDGTSAGTTTLSSGSLGFMYGVDALGYSAIYNGKIFFGATNGIDGKQLWTSDGTSAGTALFKKIGPSNYYGSYMRYFVQFNGKLFFLLDDGTHGLELWATDGTASGTQMVVDINPSGNGFDYVSTGNPANPSFTVMNNKLYFKANDGVNGLELWVTDGTASGTKMVSDINTASATGSFNAKGSGRLGLFIAYNNNLYFAANESAGSGYWLWSSDGTASGTKKFLNKDNSPFAWANNFTVFNGKLYFYGSADVQLTPNYWVKQAGLWVTDGTVAGTSFIKDLGGIAGDNGLSDETRIGTMRIFNNKMYFAGTEPRDTQAHLWVSDGTTAGTVLIKKINTNGTSFSDAFVSNIFNNKLFFIADDGNGFDLYSTDGTSAGTVKVNSPTHSLTQQLKNTQELVIANGSLYFMANYTGLADLWRIKGQATGIENNLESSLPTEFKLEQNYPNPFNPTTNIQYQVSSSSNVTLKVYDVLGKEVAVLVNEEKQAGRYSVQLSANSYQLSSGMYFYKLTAGNYSTTKKMLLMK